MESSPGNSENMVADKSIRKLVLVLLLLSICAVAARVLVLDPRTGSGNSLWRLMIDMSIDGNTDSAIQLSPPIDTAHLHLMQQTLWRPGFDISYTKKEFGRAEILAFPDHDGRSDIGFEFVVALEPPRHAIPGSKHEKLKPSERKRYLSIRTESRSRNSFVARKAASFRGSKKTDQLVADAIFKYVRSLPVDKGQDTLNPERVLKKSSASQIDRVVTMVALCRAAGIPARVVTGIELQEYRDVRVQHWVQAYIDRNWLSYDFGSDTPGIIPDTFLPMKYGDLNFYKLNDAQLKKLDLGVEHVIEEPRLAEKPHQHAFNLLDLTRLPQNVKQDLALLLLLPFGALVTALCRYLVGVRSYGVFTPTLLALALVYTNIVITIGIFLIVCLLAVAGRSLFPENMSRIPRLSIIFTLVAIILSLLISMLNYLDLQVGNKVILLPIIILTSLIDRLYRTIEDKGIQIAMHRLAWTVLIALLCLPVIQFERLGDLLLHFPEIHLATLAAFLLISTYKGKQLMRLPIIRILKEPGVEPASNGNRPGKPGESTE